MGLKHSFNGGKFPIFGLQFVSQPFQALKPSVAWTICAHWAAFVISSVTKSIENALFLSPFEVIRKIKIKIGLECSRRMKISKWRKWKEKNWKIRLKIFGIRKKKQLQIYLHIELCIFRQHIQCRNNFCCLSVTRVTNRWAKHSNWVIKTMNLLEIDRNFCTVVAGCRQPVDMVWFSLYPIRFLLQSCKSLDIELMTIINSTYVWINRDD